ncbi:hypothetical protein B0O80DRAFT_461696, partial [Mortierella sp. GBAus27b]
LAFQCLRHSFILLISFVDSHAHASLYTQPLLPLDTSTSPLSVSDGANSVVPFSRNHGHLGYPLRSRRRSECHLLG